MGVRVSSSVCDAPAGSALATGTRKEPSRAITRATDRIRRNSDVFFIVMSPLIKFFISSALFPRAENIPFWPEKGSNASENSLSGEDCTK